MDSTWIWLHQEERDSVVIQHKPLIPQNEVSAAIFIIWWPFSLHLPLTLPSEKSDRTDGQQATECDGSHWWTDKGEERQQEGPTDGQTGKDCESDEILIFSNKNKVEKEGISYFIHISFIVQNAHSFDTSLLFSPQFKWTILMHHRQQNKCYPKRYQIVR